MADMNALIIGLIGLLVGSFLNVVIHRLPRMLEREWQTARSADTEPAPRLPPYNLLWPGSHCPACQRPVAPLENIPLISYLLLRGRCAGCSGLIAWRYPLVELLSTVLSLLVYLKLGWSLETAAALVLTYGLIALAFIDLEHQLLPDALTQPLLWLGLMASLVPLFADSHASIPGAVAGYLSLWLVYQAFRGITGREGMGYGDFKLLALLGAWLGWQALPTIVLTASLAGVVTGIVLIVLKKHRAENPLPFGPFLATAGWLSLLYG